MTKKLIAYTPQGNAGLGSDSHKLQCSICGEVDRNELIVEDMNMGWGVGGNEYSFCKKCWYSENLGKNILIILNTAGGIKYKDDVLEFEEVDI